MAIGVALLLAQLLVPWIFTGQEVRYIDLTGVRQRTSLRHPAAPPTDCKAGMPCAVSGWGGSGVADGAPDPRDPHQLTVQILSVVPDRIDAAQPIEVEFRVLNSGSVPLELPVSPHLSDLQPPDESQSFSYTSLALAVNVIVGDARLPIAGAPPFVELYGSAEDAGTMLVLSPGDWIRVRANVKLSSASRESFPASLSGTFSLRTNTFHLGLGGYFTESHNLYPNAGTAPHLPVQILPSNTR
jgi:hypothetical protein